MRSLKPYTFTVRNSDHIRIIHFCLSCPPFDNCCIYLHLLHTHSASTICVQVIFDVLSETFIQPWCSSIVRLCKLRLWLALLNDFSENVEPRLKKDAFLQSHNICGTYASPFQSGIATVVSYTWDLEWWLIDDIPFELNSIAIWEYLTVFVLCIIMEHSLVPTMALLRRGIQPVSAQSWVHVFFCCNLKSSSFHNVQSLFYFINAHFSHPTCIHEGCT